MSMRMFAKPAPHTMNKEWQEAANEYLKVCCFYMHRGDGSIYGREY